MSWKIVFNTNLKFWRDISQANKAAKDSGYDFFAWNGNIYNVDGEITHLTVDDCH